MGNHRAERRGPRRRPSETRQATTKYAGRRVAGREASEVEVPISSGSDTLVLTSETTSTPSVPDAAASALIVASVPAPAPVPIDPTSVGLDVDVRRVEDEPAASLDTTTAFDADETAQLPLIKVAPGKRKAVRSARRGSLVRGLPPVPVLLGVAALAVSAGGAALTAQDADPASATSARVTQASALSGASGNATVELQERRAVVSRDGASRALGDVAEAEQQAAAEQQARQRNGALDKLAKQAEQQAAKIEANRWVLPIAGYRLTAEFGDYGLWATYHTGLDFAAPSGTPLRAVANARVTSTGYDGAYGNKTVLTLEDGTEIWYCHQTSISVSVGDTVRAGQDIGTVGSTGHVTGPHLHLEVRPGGGDPVDPATTLHHHGVTP